MNFINRFLTIAKPYSLELWALAVAHSQTLRAIVVRHPKHVTAALALVLLGGGGGAWALGAAGSKSCGSKKAWRAAAAAVWREEGR
jgi:hypothetical protein